MHFFYADEYTNQRKIFSCFTGSQKIDQRWLKHELVHIEQYKKHGLLKFLTLYLWYSMKYGYYNNPFEVEAREKEKELPDLKLPGNLKLK